MKKRTIISRKPEHRKNYYGHVLTLSCGHKVWRKGIGPRTGVYCFECDRAAEALGLDLPERVTERAK